MNFFFVFNFEIDFLNLRMNLIILAIVVAISSLNLVETRVFRMLIFIFSDSEV